MKTLLLTAPMTQLNTPYPATAYLTGFLRGRGHEVRQADLAIALVLRLLSRDGLTEIRDALLAGPARRRQHDSVAFFLEAADDYIGTVEAAVRFLQGRDASLAYRISARTLLPEGPRYQILEQWDDGEGGDPLAWAFGSLGLQDRARFLASLYIEDLADVIREGIDDRFAFVRYGESLAESQARFEPLQRALTAPPTLVDRALDALATELALRERPELVGITAPFAGNVYGAFRIAGAVRRALPEAKIVLGGGFVSTELRSLAEPAVFDWFDAVVMDAGERPFLHFLEGKPPVRTFVREDAKVVLRDTPGEADIPFAETGTPTWDGLPLDRYLGVLDMLNPMHRLWSDTRWNKVTVAHGCYWKQCSFCDLSLDYIGRYEAPGAKLTVDRMEAQLRETGTSGFHLVDEAAPPRRLDELAEELSRRNLPVTWWGNIRFEKAFTAELCEKLAGSGCVGVTGGLEVASDRLLAKMKKGVTVAQAARVTKAFSDAGVLVHAYLMYGFPTQTVQETIDAAEVVRQLIAEGCIQSAFWHRFAATAHSPVGRDPGAFGVRLLPEPEVRFARNTLHFEDPTGVDHDPLGQGLDKALYNWMHGVGLDSDVRDFFEVKVPAPKVPKNLILRALSGA